ncbi:hypothetical protein PVAP13_9NG851078 [Panicum virgatum]|uniref:Uncharacterized protein n=1 Tax=Panicum virgatum TaxID=38727 RepID=A0A8T0N571_PANVG|nr:hypothetical protein PVAP13_9NG851078 [Panicum virgatum]
MPAYHVKTEMFKLAYNCVRENGICPRRERVRPVAPPASAREPKGVSTGWVTVVVSSSFWAAARPRPAHAEHHLRVSSRAPSTRRRPSTSPSDTRRMVRPLRSTDRWAEHANVLSCCVPRRAVSTPSAAVAPVAGVGLAVEDKRACDMISMPAQSGPTSNLRDGVATGQNGVRGPSIRHGPTTQKGFAPVQALSLAWM